MSQPIGEGPKISPEFKAELDAKLQQQTEQKEVTVKGRTYSSPTTVENAKDTDQAARPSFDKGPSKAQRGIQKASDFLGECAGAAKKAGSFAVKALGQLANAAFKLIPNAPPGSSYVDSKDATKAPEKAEKQEKTDKSQGTFKDLAGRMTTIPRNLMDALATGLDHLKQKSTSNEEKISSWDAVANQLNPKIGQRFEILDKWDTAIAASVNELPEKTQQFAIEEEKRDNVEYRQAVNKSLDQLENTIHKCRHPDYTIEGGFHLEPDAASAALSKHVTGNWATLWTQKPQALTDHQIDADATRSTVKIGENERIRSGKNASIDLRSQVKAEVEKNFPALSPEKSAKVQRFILERLDETNTNTESQAAVALGFANSQLMMPTTTPLTEKELEGGLIKKLTIADGVITMSTPTAWNLQEDVLVTCSNDKPREMGRVIAVNTLQVKAEDILNGTADSIKPKISVKLQH